MVSHSPLAPCFSLPTDKKSTTIAYRLIYRAPPFLWWSMVVIALLLLAGMVLKGATTATYQLLFRDVVSSANIPLFQGAFSRIGIMLWSASIGVLSLAAILAYRRQRDEFTFLLCSLAVVTVLGLDDAFLLHEMVFDRMLGVPEKLVLLVYGCAIIAYLIYFRRLILGSSWLLLFLSLSALALSVGVDALPRIAAVIGRDPLFLLEDGAKLTGIVCWTAYYLRYCATTLSDRVGEE